MPRAPRDRIRTATSRSRRAQMEAARAEAFADDDEVSKSDIQQAIEREARRAAFQAMADLDLAGGSQLLVSGMAGVARVLDMSRSKLHRLRAAATKSGIPFPQPALYAGLGSTKSYWLRDIESWIEGVSASGMDWYPGVPASIDPGLCRWNFGGLTGVPSSSRRTTFAQAPN